MFNKTNLESMIQLRNQNKNKKKQAARHNRMSKVRKTVRKEVGCNPPLEWDRLDKRGNPLVSFDLNDARRGKLLRILETEGPHRNKIIVKLQSEFIRLYTRYRKMVMRETGVSRETIRVFSVNKRDERYGAVAAVLCLKNEITPTDLFKFWHNRVINLYGGKTMQIPHLRFLASEYSIITASEADETELQKPAEEVIYSIFGNDFSQLNRLDPRIRNRLMKSKHGDFRFNDRELLSVQMAARALASGLDVFIDDKIIEAAKYLAKTLYKSIGKNGN